MWSGFVNALSIKSFGTHATPESLYTMFACEENEACSSKVCIVTHLNINIALLQGNPSAGKNAKQRMFIFPNPNEEFQHLYNVLSTNINKYMSVVKCMATT